MCFDFLCNFGQQHLILRIRQGTTINVHRSSLKVPVFLVIFQSNLYFLDRFLENIQISNFTKIRPVGVELFRVNGRTDRRNEANTRFSPKSSAFCPHSVFMCFVWISEQTAIISVYSINWLVFITETECVYCAVQTVAL
jgi:hypothetical protein